MGIGGFYTVLLESGQRVICAARGRFRHAGEKPLPGDRVSVIPGQEDGQRLLGEILERDNVLVRPPVANVARLIVVTAAKHPQTDLLLVDRLLIMAKNVGAEVLLIINKSDQIQDERDAETIDSMMDAYRKAGAKPVVTCAVSGEGVDGLRAHLTKDGLSVFAGQSGTGKTSIINALNPERVREVGELSRKISRGRNTTRHAELMILPDGALIADTAGFSVITIEHAPPEELQEYYPEFEPYADQCRFDMCLHHKEPGCAVREHVALKDIDAGRFSRYCELLGEWQELWRNRYE